MAERLGRGRLPSAAQPGGAVPQPDSAERFQMQPAEWICAGAGVPKAAAVEPVWLQAAAVRRWETVWLMHLHMTGPVIADMSVVMIRWVEERMD